MSRSFVIPVGDAELVFGLDWFPLVGRKAAQAGRRLAHRHRSSHFLLAGSPPAAVGMLALKGDRARSQPFSAALALAQLHPRGTYAMLLALNGEDCWLAAVHDGVVVSRTDRLYRSRHDALQVLGELRPAFPRMQVLGEAGAPELPGLDALAAARTLECRLQPLQRWRSFLPRPVQYFLLALLLAVLGPRLWAYALPATPVAAHAPAEASPGVAWRKAVVQSAAGRTLHGVQGTRVMLDSLYSLPLRVGGWTLTTATCQPLGSAWQCTARFERASAHASNQTFLDHAWPAWSVEFSPTEHARVSWQFASHGVALAQSRLASVDANERAFVSDLQTIKPGFAQLHISVSSALPLKAPADSQGHPLPRPDHLQVYHQRALRITGPLRSAAMLLPHTASMAWKKAELAIGSAERPTLTHSGLTLTLEGAIYETNSASSIFPLAAGAVVHPEAPDASIRVGLAAGHGGN